MPSIEDIVDRLKNEDISALGEVYEWLNKKVYNRCFFLLKDGTLAEDATQEIFLKAFTRIRGLEDPNKLEGWINQMTYNYCMDYFRKKNKIQETDLEDHHQPIDLSFLSEVSDIADSQEKKALLIAEIENLKEMERIILLMHYWEGYSVAEISEQLEIGESAIKMRLKRTRSKLKESLESKGFTYPIELVLLIILNLV